jgi:hypothetical protein
LPRTAHTTPTAGITSTYPFFTYIQKLTNSISPALVKTLVRLAQVSPEAKIAIAMKMRHPSETIFFDLMAAANFRETTVVDYPLPGDVNGGGEKVHLHVYQYIPVV